jgi:hypothetical protein
MTEIVPMERITSKIYVIQGTRVMLDRDLAELYGVKTKALKQAVRRNINRFPEDFMFELSKEDFENWRSQFVTSNRDKMGLRYPPMAFTEQGIAMLSSVLNSNRAIEVNIAIMRAFVQIRKIASSQELISGRIREIEARLEDHDESIDAIFEAIVQLITTDEKHKTPIGFEVKEPKTIYGKEVNRKH